MLTFHYEGKEEIVITNLAIKQEISEEAVMLQAIRLYQLLCEGLIEVNVTRDSLKKFEGNF